jgi:hypothetical protein
LEGTPARQGGEAVRGHGDLVDAAVDHGAAEAVERLEGEAVNGVGSGVGDDGGIADVHDDVVGALGAPVGVERGHARHAAELALLAAAGDDAPAEVAGEEERHGQRPLPSATPLGAGCGQFRPEEKGEETGDGQEDDGADEKPEAAPLLSFLSAAAGHSR